MSAVLTTDSVFDAVNSGKYSSELPEEREYSIGLQLLAEGLSFGFIYVSGFFIRLPVQHATNLLRIQRLVSSSDYSLSNTDLAPLPPPSGLFSSSYRKGDVNEETALASLYTAQNINRPPLLTGFFDAFRALFSFKSEGKYFGALYRGNLLETIESYVSAKIKLAVFDQLSTLTGADMEGMIEIDENELKGMTRQQVNDYISELAEEKSKTLPIIFTKNNLCGVVSESIAASVTLPFTTLFRRISCRHPASPKTSTLEMAKEIYYKRGVSGFFPALPLTLVTTGIDRFFQNSAAPFIFGVVGVSSEKNWALSIFCLVFASLVNTAVVYPLHTIRQRLLIQGATEIHAGYKTVVVTNPDRTPYTGVWDCFQRMCAEEGFGSLYTGAWLRATLEVTKIVSSLLVDI